MKKSLTAFFVFTCWILGLKAFANIIDPVKLGNVVKTNEADKGNGNRGVGNMKSNYEK